MTTPHLDDELLSAHLDGEPVEGADHLDDCPECRARLAALRRVTAAVGTAVTPPPDDRRQAAVEAALGARVLPLEARRRRLAVLAAAAAVVAVLGSVAVLRSDDGPGDGDAVPTAALDAAGSRGPTFEGGDLGDQSDPAELALRLQAVVEPQAVGGSAASDATAGSADAESGATSQSPTAQVTPTEKRIISADLDCLATAARDYGTNLGPLLYRASLRWQGTPAVVLVYPVEGASGPLDHRVLVMARGDCRLLVAQTM